LQVFALGGLKGEADAATAAISQFVVAGQVSWRRCALHGRAWRSS
jgi:hypothetical protein